MEKAGRNRLEKTRKERKSQKGLWRNAKKMPNLRRNENLRNTAMSPEAGRHPGSTTTHKDKAPVTAPAGCPRTGRLCFFPCPTPTNGAMMEDCDLKEAPCFIRISAVVRAIVTSRPPNYLGALTASSSSAGSRWARGRAPFGSERAIPRGEECFAASPRFLGG